MKTLPSSSANKLFLSFSKKNCQLFQNSHGENFHPLMASWPGSWEQRGQCSHQEGTSGLMPLLCQSPHRPTPTNSDRCSLSTLKRTPSVLSVQPQDLDSTRGLSAVWAAGVSARVWTAAPTHVSAGYLSPGRTLSPVSGGLSLLEA